MGEVSPEEVKDQGEAVDDPNDLGAALKNMGEVSPEEVKDQGESGDDPNDLGAALKNMGEVSSEANVEQSESNNELNDLGDVSENENDISPEVIEECTESVDDPNDLGDVPENTDEVSLGAIEGQTVSNNDLNDLDDVPENEDEVSSEVIEEQTESVDDPNDLGDVPENYEIIDLEIVDKKYTKCEYDCAIRENNKFTGKMEEKNIHRTVYQNKDIDCDLVIPEGVRISNQEVTKTSMTNLERMQKGKPPVLVIENENGEMIYDRIELHHLTSEETQYGGEYFTGEKRYGSIIEISSRKHDEYTKILHSINASGSSFRKRQMIEDNDGIIIRKTIKSEDSYKYNNFRSQYWKDRAAKILQERSK